MGPKKKSPPGTRSGRAGRRGRHVDGSNRSPSHRGGARRKQGAGQSAVHTPPPRQSSKQSPNSPILPQLGQEDVSMIHAEDPQDSINIESSAPFEAGQDLSVILDPPLLRPSSFDDMDADLTMIPLRPPMAQLPLPLLRLRKATSLWSCSVPVRLTEHRKLRLTPSFRQPQIVKSFTAQLRYQLMNAHYPS